MSQNPKVPLERALKIVEKLKENVGAELFEVCGSIRRKEPLVGDVDLCIASEDFDKFTEKMKHYWPLNEKKIPVYPAFNLSWTKDGRLKSALVDGIKVELYVGPRNGFGALLMYATGSKGRNIQDRIHAASKGFKLNQYGIWDKNGAFVAGATEREIYDKLELKWLEPEER